MQVDSRDCLQHFSKIERKNADQRKSIPQAILTNIHHPLYIAKTLQNLNLYLYFEIMLQT